MNLLPQLFIVGRLGPGRYAFRLAGDFIGELHDRPLRGVDFLALWRQDDRTSLQMALEAARRRGEPLVIACDGRTRATAALRLEIALAPLVGASGDTDRYLGLYQPLSPVNDLAAQPVLGLAVRAIATPDSDDGSFPRLRLAALHGALTR